MGEFNEDITELLNENLSTAVGMVAEPRATYREKQGKGE